MTRFQRLVLSALILLLRNVAAQRGYSVGDPYFASHSLAIKIEDEIKKSAETFAHMDDRG